MRHSYIWALLAVVALPAHAQTLAEQLAERPNITFEEWQSLTNGRTVVYQVDGQTFGFEAYRADSNQVLFQTNTGYCENGTWAMQGPAFCFEWEESGQDCFLHKELNGAYYVISVADGLPTEQIQKVARISDIPLACGPALLSRLLPEVSP